MDQKERHKIEQSPEDKGIAVGVPSADFVDALSKAIRMNRVYIEQNLVTGYLANDPSNAKDVEFMERSEEIKKNSAQHLSSYNDDMDDDGEIVLNNYKNEQKKRQALLKYNSYFLFERNIAFFFNHIYQKVIALQDEKAIKLEEGGFYRLVYILCKNQIIHLERVNKQLKMKQHDKFDNETWGRYLAS